ncbi:hypothetical protein QBC46DRAFT_398232 [Diplogelasinospora grovesii]|uniref:Cytochrome c oxidase assembly protein COX20, mitochondrial n=1 Tax=Diplogelasinospora grovesii TaxID=303347 RepID=A0AAN6RZ13_9PEZI|nr:hypothetical protein QBC46DRAFT_398232 [Diplogelasinospora grovesii]
MASSSDLNSGRTWLSQPATPSSPQSSPGSTAGTTTTPSSVESLDNLPKTTLEKVAAQQHSQSHRNGVSLTEVVQTIKPKDFLSVHKAPCSRQGFLTGIGAGAGIGAIRWIMGLPVPKAANWAVGTGAAAALAQYEFCQWRRRQEREKMKRVVEVYDRKQAEMKAKEEQQKKRREEEERLRRDKEEEERTRRSWYRFW